MPELCASILHLFTSLRYVSVMHPSAMQIGKLQGGGNRTLASLLKSCAPVQVLELNNVTGNIK